MAISYQLVAHLVFCILHVASLLSHYFEATQGAFCWQCGPDSLQELNSRLGPRISVLGQSSLRDLGSSQQPGLSSGMWRDPREGGRDGLTWAYLRVTSVFPTNSFQIKGNRCC